MDLRVVYGICMWLKLVKSLSSKYFYIIIFGGKMFISKVFKVSSDGATGFQNAALLLVSTDYSE